MFPIVKSLYIVPLVVVWKRGSAGEMCAPESKKGESLASGRKAEQECPWNHTVVLQVCFSSSLQRSSEHSKNTISCWLSI